ncbi:hypothetical protein DB32_008398 [Sandaracinus amylolyticus]|uniref:Uncharacterized protein n=1 Tax=Sandaracinus amylolyticus TaxID=927083 RepID=A0A0F6SHY4_9BACT|nr:hypothetical protein DB32_008398 [Sandaracinus amylolyticus]
MVLRESDVDRWPGGDVATQRMPQFAAIGEFAGSQVIVLRDPELTTVVPLELGGVLLVTAVYCEGDRSLDGHLEMLPVSGWHVLPRKFRATGGNYTLFDGSLSGKALKDPALQPKILEEHGGVIQFALAEGTYDVECFGPWDPDAQTSLWLTRVVRSAV